jgi:small subunit ribosomal protein S7
MSRRRQAKKREIQPDRKYNSVVISKLINYVMKSGKKSVAEKLIYEALEKAEYEIKTPGLDVFNEALTNIAPTVELRSCRVGGVNYQVPVPIKGVRSNAIGIKWLIEAAMKRKGISAKERLYLEIMDARAKRGTAYKKCEDNYKMAESNRAFAHFRFFGSDNR